MLHKEINNFFIILIAMQFCLYKDTHYFLFINEYKISWTHMTKYQWLNLLQINNAVSFTDR